MRKTLIIALLLTIPVFTDAARFDWSAGEPSVLEDNEASDTIEESRYDWSAGEPSILFDTTAVASGTSSPATTTDDGSSIMWFF